MFQDTDDTLLVKRLKSGDIEAFDLIYEKYSGKLYSFGMKYLSSNYEAEELVQEVFFKLWLHRKKINKDLCFKSFLFTIAYNDICKLFRKRKYKLRFINEVLSTCMESSSGTEESIDYRSTLSLIEQIIEKLPEKQKVVFRKSRDEGKTSKEIAAELHLCSGTIDNYISSAITFIKSHLRNEDLIIFLPLTLIHLQLI